MSRWATDALTGAVAFAVSSLLLHAPHQAVAAAVESLDQGTIVGDVTIRDGKRVVITSEDGQPLTLGLEDVERIDFTQKVASANGDILLINNDTGQDKKSQSRTIKLRAGLHRFTLPYWQGNGQHALSLSVHGPGIKGQRPIGDGPQMFCFRSSRQKHEPSGGIDAEGFRLPELELKAKDNHRRMQARAKYRLYADNGQTNTVFNNIGVLTDLPLRLSGTTTEITTGIVNDPKERFGLVFEGFFVATQDGEYTFALQSDDGAQFYLGEAQSFVVDALGGTPVDASWHFELHHGGLARGELKSIQDEQATIHIPLVSDTTLPLMQFKSMWDAEVDRASIDLSKVTPGMDTVFVRDKKEPSKIVAIGGRLITLDDQAVSFEFKGKARKIERGRVAGVVLDHASRPALENPGFYQLARLRGGQLLPCRLESLGEQARFTLIGGETVAPPRDVLIAISNENGRRVDLTRVERTAEEAVPYFGTAIPSRINRSFMDEPIRLFDGKTYERGIAVHSKSRLHYKLTRPAETFKARFGLMNPGGKLGQVDARVIGDGKVLWEQKDITAKTEPIEITVALTGVQRLVLEVDFGEGQNVGDRAAWCDPQLIYAAGQSDE